MLHYVVTVKQGTVLIDLRLTWREEGERGVKVRMDVCMSYLSVYVHQAGSKMQMRTKCSFLSIYIQVVKYTDQWTTLQAGNLNLLRSSKLDIMIWPKNSDFFLLFKMRYMIY